MSRFVLVHGAWHGAWCWYKVVAELERRGHTVTAVDLPGHGVDKTPIEQVTLDAYAEKVGRVLTQSDEPAVLVGHSLGGLVITEAAERYVDHVHRLVYLCAFLEKPDEAPGESREAMKGSLVPSAMVPSENGLTTTVAKEKMREVFYGDCSDEDIALARACVVPQRMDLILESPAHTQERWGRLPRSYLLCSEDRAITLAAQQRMVERVGCDHVATLDTSHSPFFSQPALLVDALLAGG